MGQERFRAMGGGSFFGALVYDRAVPPDHFLRRLRELVDWEGLTQEWVALYEGGAEYGPPPYHPGLVLKMLFLTYLYNLSERQVELFVNDSLSAKYFLGMAADEPAPDSTTLSVFKKRLLAGLGTGAFEGLLEKVVRIARQRGIVFGRIQVVDSVHTVADVDIEKEDRRQNRGDGAAAPRDPDARWGTKGKRVVRRADGQRERRAEHFFGYKAHVSLNAATGFITSLTVTSGEAYDGHHLPALVQKDRAQRLPVAVYAGDRGYDDGENHALLAEMGLKSALRLNAYRTEKKNGNKAPWLRLQQDPDYQAGLRERYKVEQKFGEAKRGHGLRRCRYVGLVRYAVQAYLTAITLNCKRLVKLLTGIGPRTAPRRVPLAA